jgi:hypothetical protein
MTEPQSFRGGNAMLNAECQINLPAAKRQLFETEQMKAGRLCSQDPPEKFASIH